jgi:hypothetical protein
MQGALATRRSPLLLAYARDTAYTSWRFFRTVECAWYRKAGTRYLRPVMELTVCLKRWSAISSRVTSSVASTGGEDLRSVSRVNKPERTALTLSRTQEQLLRKSLPDRKARPPPRPRLTPDHRQARDQEQRPADQEIIADNVTTGGAARGNAASPALLAATSEIAAPILSETQLDAVGVGYQIEMTIKPMQKRPRCTSLPSQIKTNKQTLWSTCGTRLLRLSDAWSQTRRAHWRA